MPVLDDFVRARGAVNRRAAPPRNYAAKLVNEAIGRERVNVSFEDISKLDDLSVKDILKRVDMRTLCTALKAADDEVKEIIFRNLTDREAAALRAEVLEIGPVRLREVESAQEAVTATMRSVLRVRI